MNKLSPYDKVLSVAENIGISVIQENAPTKIPAIALRLGKDMGVFINESAFHTDAERRLAFAHEVGHCETGGFYTELTPADERNRIEYRATKWTVMQLVSFETYKMTILEGCLTYWEQAEKWDIPLEFVSKVHEIYEKTHWNEIQALRDEVARKYPFVY